MVKNAPPKEDTFVNTMNGHKMPRAKEYLSITISPPLEEQFLSSKDRQKTFLTKFTNFIHNNILGAEDYEFWLEIGLNGLYHFHGYIKIYDSVQVFESIAKLKYNKINSPFEFYGSQLRIIDVDTINSLEKWISYCSKDAEIINKKVTLIQHKEREAVTEDLSKLFGLHYNCEHDVKNKK
jgi:hypothetical protein